GQRGGLIQGQNILSASADLTAWNRFSEYHVFGQSSIGTAKEQMQTYARAFDPGVSRPRPKVIVQPSEVDSQRAQLRADWEAARAAGLSTRATITVPGFRDDSGEFWEPAKPVYVYSPFLKIDQEMVIEKVTLRQNESGTLATLDVVDPRTYGGDPSAVSNSDGLYNLAVPAIEDRR